MLRLPLLFALLAALAPFSAAQDVQERHSEVRLYAPDGAPTAHPGAALADRLAASGLVLDHARREDTALGPALRTVLSATELAQARAAGIEVDVLVEDLRAHYLATRQGTCQEGRAAVSRIDADLCGAMGGYPTFSAILDLLDALHDAHPEIVSARTSIGQSIEGRDLWMVEISDNPGLDEAEPEALYTALHHAREPGSMMAVLYFMHYLAEQYGTNPDVTDLVDGRRLFFVPVLNPDGYVYNETTDPGGGGFWRKNRRNNGGGTYGIDLNRNYGYFWGYDNVGSSPNPWSETYRGTAPFSEPETQALRNFLESGRSVRIALNYHTSGDLLLYPWGYEYDTFTPDEAAFAALGDTLTYRNHYTYGQGANTIYKTNGGSDDWMYGEQTTKPKIFSFTPEVGYAFWPDPYDVYPLADENLEMNLLVAEFAEDFVPVPIEPAGAVPNGVALDLAGPNPLRDRTTFVLSLPEAQPVRLAVFDLLGREVAVLADGAYASGPHRFPFDASALAPGAYLVRLDAEAEAVTQRVTVVR